MANTEVELRSSYFGQASVIRAEMVRLFRLRRQLGSWSAVKDALKTGDIPYFKPGDINTADVYDAGAADGCPITKPLLEVEKFDPTELMNLYIARHRANRMFARLLRETGNQQVLALWRGNEPRAETEKRIASSLQGTPNEIIEQGNPHVGAAKYENFVICQLFRYLTDAEHKLPTPTSLPQGVKLYPERDYFQQEAREATDLTDFTLKVLCRILPFMLDKGVSQVQAAQLLIETVLNEPLLVEDNCWERAISMSFDLWHSLLISDNARLVRIADLFSTMIYTQIETLKRSNP